MVGLPYDFVANPLGAVRLTFEKAMAASGSDPSDFDGKDWGVYDLFRQFLFDDDGLSKVKLYSRWKVFLGFWVLSFCFDCVTDRNFYWVSETFHFPALIVLSKLKEEKGKKAWLLKETNFKTVYGNRVAFASLKELLGACRSTH